VVRSTRRFQCALTALALIGASCGGASASTLPLESTTTSTTAPTTTESIAAPRTTSSVAPTTTTIPDPYRTLIATARDATSYLTAYDGPDGLPIALPFRVSNPHQFEGPLTLMVTEGDLGDDWVKVQLPIRPNETEAWIPASDYVLSESRIRAEVELSSTTVRVYDGDELIAESQAAIGTEKTPTPVGTFFVAAKRLNPPEESYLGTWAVVLSSYSEVLPSFSGGLPVIAIHGTNNPDAELGQAISNGCVRVPEEVIQFIAEHVPLGAPVEISA
jgi:lipoprotein-anchoring transpeptidase ErfK/SrfK